MQIAIKKQEAEANIVELAIEILKEPPTAHQDAESLRKWARSTIDKYSSIKLPDYVITNPISQDYTTPDSLTTLQRVRYRDAIEAVGVYTGLWEYCTSWLFGEDTIMTTDQCAKERLSDLSQFQQGYHSETKQGSSHFVREKVKVLSKEGYAILKL